MALLAVWVNNIVFLAAVGLAALISPIAISWVREKAEELTINADKCRRLILYADGLGDEITKEDMATVRAWVMGWELKDAPFVSPYYSSDKPKGPNRLADIACESAFFTMHLVNRVITRLAILLTISILMVIAILFLSDSLFGTASTKQIDTIGAVAKSIAFAIAFIISGDFALLLKKYFDLKSLAVVTFNACARMRDDITLNERQIRHVVEDYGIGLIKSPPIPAGLYTKYRDKLNTIYRNSHNMACQ